MRCTTLHSIIVLTLSITLAGGPVWARGFGGGGFRGGGGGGFRGGGGSFGGGGGFHGGGNFGGGGMRLPSGGAGLSGGGFHPSAPSRPPLPSHSSFPSGGISPRPGSGLSPGSNRPQLGGGGIGGLNHPDLVHHPNLGGGVIGLGDRPQLRPDGGISRPDLTPGNRPGLQPGGINRPGNLPGVTDHFPGRDSLRPGGGTASLPGLGPVRPGAGGAGTQRPGLRPGEGGAGERFPGLRPGQDGAGERWTPGDRGSIPERHNDLANRFDDLQNHWNDTDWHHNQWTGPNGGDLNHFGFWGPNGYWGHTGVWGPNGGYAGHSGHVGPNGAWGHSSLVGPNGGYWGHTGAVGPGGAWGHTGYFGPSGHWSRNWGWYNGYSPAWGNGRWNYLWDNYPVAMAFGMTTWGINCVAWGMGISSYYNPYYTTPVVVDNQTIVSYDQPVVGDASDDTSMTTTDDSAAANADTASPPDPLTEKFDAARQAFSAGDYAAALPLTNQALKLAPRDAAINEFRSLCLFALGQYRESAATIHAVLAAGPGWDWTTMISLYGDADAYTQQLRQLETAVKANTDDAAQHFLLGYHYLTANHKEAAVNQWREVTRLQPKDQLASELVQMYAPPSDAGDNSSNQPSPDLDKPAYPLEKLHGNWTARNDSGQFTLNLGDDDKFTWSFARDGQPQSVSGVYIVRGNNLVLQPDSGGTMAATIMLADNQLKFVPVGDAQALTFTR